MAKKYLLLPYDYFGGLKQKTTFDILLVLKGKIYQVWKNKKVLSFITFDIKKTYNKVAVKVLIDRLQKGCLQKQIIYWIKGFCNNRKAIVSINREISGISFLP